jgi:hypothetical protein
MLHFFHFKSKKNSNGKPHVYYLLGSGHKFNFAIFITSSEA